MNASVLVPPTASLLSSSCLFEEDSELALLIARRLGNRIRDLRVIRREGGLVIQGRSNTYYAKQLAQHAAMELDAEPVLANDIEVS